MHQKKKIHNNFKKLQEGIKAPIAPARSYSVENHQQYQKKHSKQLTPKKHDNTVTSVTYLHLPRHEDTAIIPI